MAEVATIVDAALRAAGVPILGVSIGQRTDRSTWRVEFDPAATPAHHATAATILQTVAVDAAAQTARDQRDAQGQIDSLPVFQRAIILTLLDQINVLRAGLPVPLPAVTPAQALAAIRTKAGTLT